MYIAARAALTVVLLSALSSALSAEPLSPAEQKLLDSISSNPEKRQEALARLNATSAARDTFAQPKSKATKAAPTLKAAAPSTTKPDAITQLIESNEHKAPSDRQYSPCPGWVIFVRQNWKDLGGAGAACPDAAKNAQGAQISFADDRAANNRVATINGTAAVVYNSVTGDVPAPLPFAVSFGAYTTVDDVSNSATSQLKSNVDTLAYGGLLELGYNNGTVGSYFTLRGGGVQD
jgi:hypothetical protein